MDVVQDPLGDDGVVRLAAELLEADPPVALPCRRARIHRDRVVPRVDEPRRDPAALAATDLEDPRRRGRQLRECERGEVH